MIKVMHVLSDMKVGGAGKWLINLLKAADRSRFEIKVVLPSGSMLIDIIKGLGYEVVTVDGMQDKSFDKGTIALLYKMFKNYKPHIVHTHASLSARIAARMAGVKAVVHTKHCIDAPKKGLAKSAGAFVNSRLSDRIIAVSEAVKQNIVEAGLPEEKTEVIYGGIDELRELPEDQKTVVRESLGIGRSDIVAGMVARLAEVKGHVYFIEAADIISKSADNVKFLIAGIGPKEQELKKLVAEKGLQQKVIFVGYVEDIDRIYNIIDINVISSVSEALCLSLIEGMCLGKPSVGTNVGGIPEVIRNGENGLLVPARDSQALAEAILKLAKDPLLRKTMGQKGREFMKMNFTNGAMAEKIESLYEKLAPVRH